MPSISRRHAAAWATREIPYVRDLGSQTGTFVNSAPVSGPTALRQGDLVALGPGLVFLVEREEIEAEETAPTASDPVVDTPLVELALSASVTESIHRRYLEGLFAICERAATSLNEAQLLSGILDDLERVMTAARFFVMLGADAAALSIVARKLCSPEESKKWSLPSREILGRAISSDKPVITFDAKSDERFRRRTSVALSDVHSAICVSLRTEGAPLGVLYADSHAGAGLFSMDDGNFISAASRALTLGLLRLRARSAPGAIAPPPQGKALSRTHGEIEAHLARLREMADAAAARPGDSVLAGQIRAECRRVEISIAQIFDQAPGETTAHGMGEPRER